MLTKMKEIAHLIKVVIFIGMPGSTKTTMAEVAVELQKTLDPFGKDHKTYKLLTMSDLIRQEIKDPKSPHRRQLLEEQAKMDAGDLASDIPVLETLDTHVARSFFNDGALKLKLDGCTRNEFQCRALLATGVEWRAIYLNIHDENTARKRIYERAKKSERLDDMKPETIENRLLRYRNETLPVVDFLREIDPDKVVEIDARISFAERAKATMLGIGYSGTQLEKMMVSLRTAGTNANNLMRKALGQTELKVTRRSFSIQQEVLKS